jgi:anti-sigma regulatory factor (Ser/Thr protein kinase)
MNVSYEVIANNFDLAGEASSKLKVLLQRIGVPANVIRRIAIGTYEAEMNIIIHAGHDGKVEANITPDKTTVIISDDGPGIENTELALKEGFSTAPDYVRAMGFGAGMGLPNMQKCSDKFKIQSACGQGTVITMEFLHS